MKVYNPKIKPKNSIEIKEFSSKKGIAKKFLIRYRTGVAFVSNGKIEGYFTGSDALKNAKLNFNK